MEIGYCLDGSSHKQSSAVLVKADAVIFGVRTTDVASSQQPRRMETDNGLAPLMLLINRCETLLYVNSLQPCW